MSDHPDPDRSGSPEEVLRARLESARARLQEIRAAAEAPAGAGGTLTRLVDELADDLDAAGASAAELLDARDVLVGHHLERHEELLRDVSAYRDAETELRESQRFIAGILGALTAHVAVLDDRGDVIAVNTAWERFAKEPGAPSSGLGTNYLGTLDALAEKGSRQAGEAAAGIRRILAGEADRFSTEVSGRRSGKERWHRLQILAMAGRGPTRLVVAREEITQRRQAEEALRQSMDRTQLILDAAVDGILTIDETGAIESVNPAAERMFGYAASELLGENVKVLMPPPYRGEHDGYLERYLETGEKKIIGIGREVIARRRDGSDFPIDLAVSEVFMGGKRTFMGTIRDITQRKEIEQALRRERDFAESLVETAQVIVLVLDTEARIVRFNRFFEEVSGYSLDEVQGRDWFTTFLPLRDHDRIRQLFARAVDDVPTRGNVNPIVARDGSERQIEWHSKTLRDAGGEITGVLATGHDITERLELEEQFRQAQKLEAIGRLAGGVAHDFNTLLGSILGYSEMVLDGLDDDDELLRPARQIRRGAERGAALTRQLLAFSRRQVLEPEVLDLNAVVREMDDMLRRLIGADFELEHRPDPDLGTVKVDAGQIQQVVMNLVVNACDAMAGSDGRRITVATENVDVGEAHPDRAAVLAPGRYVRLTVSDAGCGMDEPTRRRIFEPFFTTKETGKGTGLGLSMVYGIVRQSGGGVAVDSRPGEGSAFKVYLLRSEEEAAAKKVETPAAAPRRGSETVLLVEDDEMFRELLEEVLEASGYDVMAAGDSAEALALAAGREGPVDLLVSDMVMPGMSGKELASRLARERPEMKILLMSGYSDEALAERGMVSESGFIQKPFSTKELVRKVRARLDGGE